MMSAFIAAPRQPTSGIEGMLVLHHAAYARLLGSFGACDTGPQSALKVDEEGVQMLL